MVDMVPAVLRFRDGHIVRVTLPAGELPSSVLRVVDEGGEAVEVPLARLKGIFYTKQPQERLLARDLPAESIFLGTNATIEFEDGEVMIGRIGSFDGAQPGFFLYPASPQDNNSRVYVVTAAVRSVELRR